MASPNSRQNKLKLELEFIEAQIVARAALKKSYFRHDPHPKQQEFLDLTCDEALYGGAAGGGKSEALLMCCLKFVKHADFSALILRRSYQELVKSGALMDRSHDWLDGAPGVKWSEQKHRWTFPSGSTIEFGHFDNLNDRMQYQSAQWNIICFDELTHFPEDWYSFMFTRIRKGMNPALPSYMRSATNPGSIGHEWVKRRFLVDKHPDRVFVPAGFRDNPGIDHNDYEKKLGLASDVVRRQMLGEWVHDGTGLVYKQCTAANLISYKDVPKLDYHMLGVDFGVVDDNALTVVGWKEHEPTLYILESRRKSCLIDELAAEILALEKIYKFDRIVGDEGGQGKLWAEEIRKRRQIPLVPAEKKGKIGFIRLMNDDFARGRTKIVASACKDLLQEYRELYWDETGQKEISTALNHAADSALYVWREAGNYAEQPKVAAKPGSIEEMVERAEEEFRKLPQEEQKIWQRQDEIIGSSTGGKQWWEF